MKFTKLSDTSYTCYESDSGKSYWLTGEVVPKEEWDELECPRATGRGIWWSCGCSVAQHGKECKHLRGLFREVFGNPGDTEEEHKYRKLAH